MQIADSIYLSNVFKIMRCVYREYAQGMAAHDERTVLSYNILLSSLAIIKAPKYLLHDKISYTLEILISNIPPTINI